MELSKAQEIAVKICYQIQPYCHKIHIAGSIRRKKHEVKDIEICCIPYFEKIESVDLFGGSNDKIVVHNQFIKMINELGKIEKGSPTGRYCKIVLPEQVNLDLFMPEPDDFYRQYAIRTGSADYSFKVIATAWRRLGWVGSDLGLREEKDCIETKQPDGKSKWTCVRNKDNKPPVWQSEEHFFEWLKVPFVKPEFRFV